MKNITDREGNFIGTGAVSAKYDIIDMSDYPQVEIKVDKSLTTESVYVKYCLGLEKVVCRFAHHNNNAVKFGDQLNGYIAEKDEILALLGLKNRTFVPNKYFTFGKKQVKKSECANYEETNLTIQEIYALGKDADITAHVGKLAKGSNWLILTDTIREVEETRTNQFGVEVLIGKYIYA